MDYSSNVMPEDDRKPSSEEAAAGSMKRSDSSESCQRWVDLTLNETDVVKAMTERVAINSNNDDLSSLDSISTMGLDLTTPRDENGLVAQFIKDASVSWPRVYEDDDGCARKRSHPEFGRRQADSASMFDVAVASRTHTLSESNIDDSVHPGCKVLISQVEVTNHEAAAAPLIGNKDALHCESSLELMTGTKRTISDDAIRQIMATLPAPLSASVALMLNDKIQQDDELAKKEIESIKKGEHNPRVPQDDDVCFETRNGRKIRNKGTRIWRESFKPYAHLRAKDFKDHINPTLRVKVGLGRNYLICRNNDGSASDSMNGQWCLATKKESYDKNYQRFLSTRKTPKARAQNTPIAAINSSSNQKKPRGRPRTISFSSSTATDELKDAVATFRHRMQQNAEASVAMPIEERAKLLNDLNFATQLFSDRNLEAQQSVVATTATMEDDNDNLVFDEQI